MGLKEWVTPQDTIFYELFEELAEIAYEAADLLVNIIDDFTHIDEKCRQMKTLEHKGDALAHRAFEELNKTFITPIEPEEISRLVTALDDVIDYIDSGTKMFLVYEIEEPDHYMAQFAEVIRNASDEIRTGVKGLRTLQDPETIKGGCIEINRLENQADDILSNALHELFKCEDPVRIIKLKDIYEHFEIATDKCEDVADVFASILIRHT